MSGCSALAIALTCMLLPCMPELVIDCPHCGSEKVGFTFGGAHPDVTVDYAGVVPVAQIWTALFCCRRCGEGVVAKLDSGTPPMRDLRDLEACDADVRQAGFRIRSVHPQAVELRAPEHVPESVARDYREALDSLRRRNLTSAALMFRKTVEGAVSHLQGERAANVPLAARINALADLPGAMRDWADIIRLGGNKAAHADGAPVLEEVEQAREFTELLLLYAFTLPTRVRDARKRFDGKAR